MWRTLLTCWFMVNTLFAQGACCCAFLNGLPARLLSSADKGCCPLQCCGSPDTTETSWRTSTGNPPARPCPFRVNPSREMVSTSPEAEKNWLRQLAPPVGADGSASSLAPQLSPAPDAAAFVRGPHLPFHPTSELLRAFHLLRC
jgi:hypothetical protein